nr:hypothetical protein StreXyl84_40710 [Streptomyces sp. Xyl84]
MYRGVVHVLAWSLATSAAVTLSWWGVHTVMAGTAYDPPRALPVTAAGADARRSETPGPSAHRPAPSKSPSAPPAAPARTPAPSSSNARGASGGSADSGTARTTAPAGDGGSSTGSAGSAGSAGSSGGSGASGQVKSYDTAGGRVVFDLGTASATLVSATPGTGWSMQVWKTATWIRVEFTSGTDRVSVICTWHDGPPRVEVGDY